MASFALSALGGGLGGSAGGALFPSKILANSLSISGYQGYELPPSVSSPMECVSMCKLGLENGFGLADAPLGPRDYSSACGLQDGQLGNDGKR